MLKLRQTLSKLSLSEAQVIRQNQQVRWRMRRGFMKEKKKPFVIDPSYYTPGGPVSGSVEHGDLAKTRKFDFDMSSLQSRGFYRFQEQYDPPHNAREKMISLAKSCNTKLSSMNENELFKYQFADSVDKYNVLTKAAKEFRHAVPNSLLYMIQSLGDAVEFYETPVSTNTPYDELIRNKSLPPNLHIQKEPLRFHPDTDTMFGGVTVFTKSSNIVTGLRAKKKYKGHVAQKYWPPEDDAGF